MDETQDVEEEILFYKFENHPDNYKEIEKKLRANYKIWQFIQGYSAKSEI